MIETLGLDTYFKLHHNMEKATYRFGPFIIMNMMREFIQEHAAEYTPGELKTILGCSDRFVSKVLNEIRQRKKDDTIGSRTNFS